MGWIDRYFERIGIEKSRVAIYARVSTDTDGHQDLHAQIQACRDFCQKRGWTDVEEYIEAPGATAAEHQPELKRLRSEIQGGMVIHSVVVETTARLTRNLDRLADIEQLLKKNGAQIVTVKE